MDAFEERKNRQIIPRWLPYKSACALIPNDALPLAWMKALISAAEFAAKRSAWVRCPTSPFAIDLVASALIRGDKHYPEVQQAAQLILNQPSSLTPSDERMAQVVLGADETFARIVGLRREQIAAIIRTLKGRVKESLRNPILHLDLAYYYTLLSQHHKADLHIRIALATAHENSYVLLAAARYYLHRDGNPDQCLWVLRKSYRTPSSPTLLAAELSISEAFELRSPFQRIARKKLFEFDIHPWYRSDLAGTIGTLEANSGSMKGAKRALRAALECPTENALAQVRWLSLRAPIGNLIPEDCHPAAAFEADMIASMQAGNYHEALQFALGWTEFEPYAAFPAMNVSYIASITLENFGEAERILQTAMLANPDSFILKNNLAFAIASSDRPMDASAILDSIDMERVPKEHVGICIATHGLIQFRKGDLEGGRAYYQSAVDGFRQLGNRLREATAMMFWAQEELRAETDMFPEVAKEALKLSRHSPSLPTPLENRVRLALERTPHA